MWSFPFFWFNLEIINKCEMKNDWDSHVISLSLFLVLGFGRLPFWSSGAAWPQGEPNSDVGMILGMLLGWLWESLGCL